MEARNIKFIKFAEKQHEQETFAGVLDKAVFFRYNETTKHYVIATKTPIDYKNIGDENYEKTKHLAHLHRSDAG